MTMPRRAENLEASEPEAALEASEQFEAAIGMEPSAVNLRMYANFLTDEPGAALQPCLDSQSYVALNSLCGHCTRASQCSRRFLNSFTELCVLSSLQLAVHLLTAAMPQPTCGWGRLR